MVLVAAATFADTKKLGFLPSTNPTSLVWLVFLLQFFSGTFEKLPQEGKSRFPCMSSADIETPAPTKGITLPSFKRFINVWGIMSKHLVYRLDCIENYPFCFISKALQSTNAISPQPASMQG